MSISTDYSKVYSATQSYTTQKKAVKTQSSENTKDTTVQSGVSVEFSGAGLEAAKAAADASAETADTVTQKNNQTAENSQSENKSESIPTEKTPESRASVIAKGVTKMSDSERAALVKQLKSDQASRESQLAGLVEEMLTNQAGISGGNTNIWKILASGKFSVDAKTKAQAKEDISEDGYYGVKQTSERMFQFAMALSNGDEEKMKSLQAAMKKGYEKAEKTWGGELPKICQDTMAAADKLFEDYYASLKETSASAEDDRSESAQNSASVKDTAVSEALV